MMRQTAAFQVSLDLDDEPWLRWRVLNAAAPYVVAIFANSPVYEGARTGCPSARAAGVARRSIPRAPDCPGMARDPVGPTSTSRCGAPAILLPAVDGEHRRSASGSRRARPTLEEWHDHLTTLFPEVRPRGHFELRSC